MSEASSANTTNSSAKSKATLLDIARQADAMAASLASLATTASERQIVGAIGRQALDRAFGRGVRL